MKRQLLTGMLLGTALLIGNPSTNLESTIEQSRNYGTRIEIPITRYEMTGAKPELLTTARSVVDSNYVNTTILVESSGQPKAISKSGALGLGQIKPSTWVFINGKNRIKVPERERNHLASYLEDRYPYWESLSENERNNLVKIAYEAFNPAKNKESTRKYLKYLEDFCKEHPEWENLSFDERREKIWGAYHAGPNALKLAGWEVNNLREPTKHYVLKNKKKFDEVVRT